MADARLAVVVGKHGVLVAGPRYSHGAPVRETAASDAELIEAIRTVARGDVFLYPNAAKLLLQGFRGKSSRAEEGPLEKLTERELEVLGYTAEGFSSAEIGKKLFISPKTVDTYKQRINEKLGLRHRADYVRLALKLGLLEDAAGVQEVRKPGSGIGEG